MLSRFSLAKTPPISHISGMSEGTAAIATPIDEIQENLSLLDDWDDRYRYIIELGRTLTPLPAADYNDANKVRGCASQVWLDTQVRPDGRSGPILNFRGDSDAHIVRGLIAILFAIYSGKPARNDPGDRRGCAVRANGPARAPYTATLERISIDGRTHPVRCPRRTGAGLTISDTGDYFARCRRCCPRPICLASWERAAA